jgi:MFS family permease
MVAKSSPSFITLLLLISFASVNAVLFTPALPDLTNFFGISEERAQQTILWFLIGYALGQLMYGPIANRFGRKPALYVGIGIQIVSSFLCVLSGACHTFTLMVIARFLMALGSGVGLKMTFTLVNECFEPSQVSQKVAYLMLAFAVTPGLAVALGGVLTTHYGWESCFYAGAMYGIVLLVLVSRLPETLQKPQWDALQLRPMLRGYANQFQDKTLVAGGLLMGGATCFVYVFAALAPFIAMNLLGMTSMEYGLAALLPSLGLITGSIVSAKMAKRYPPLKIVLLGVSLAVCSTLAMILAAITHQSPMITLFLPMILNYFGQSLVFGNASSIAMRHVSDKAYGSAVMSFINMGLATLVVLSLGLFSTSLLLLPLVFLGVSVEMLLVIHWLRYSVRQRMSEK